MGRRHRLIKRILLLHIPLFFLGTFLLFPFLWMGITSIKPDPEMYDFKQFPLLVKSPTLSHYAYVLLEMPFFVWLRNSILISFFPTIISVVIGGIAGYSIARLRFRGAVSIGMGIFVTYLVPQAILFLPLAYVMHKINLDNSLFSLIITYPTFLIPFCTWILMGYFKTIPKEIEECAMIDGCSRMRAFVQVVLPLASPGIISASIFAFTLSWIQFLYPLTFIQSQSAKPLVVAIPTAYAFGDVFFWGRLMAAAILASLPLAIIYAFLQKYYISGLTAGAVKY